MIIHQSDWMKITGQTSGEIEIDITGVIGGSFWDEDSGKNNTREKMREELKKIASLKARKLVVNIDSPGGLVSHGLSIYHLLADSAAIVETRVVGMTASIATVIAQAAKPGLRKMSDAALMLVHEARSIAMGTSEDFKTEYENLETVNDKIADIYAAKSGKDRQYFRDLMAEGKGEGRWLDSGDAIEIGLVDSEIVVTRAAAVWGDDIFTNLQINKPKMTKQSKSLSAFFGSLVSFFEGFKAENPDVEIPQVVSEKITEFENKVAEIETRNQELETQLSASATEVSTLTAQVAEQETTIGTLRDEAAAQSARVEELASANSTLTAEVERLTGELQLATADPLRIKGSDPKDGGETLTGFDADLARIRAEENEIRQDGPGEDDKKE